LAARTPRTVAWLTWMPNGPATLGPVSEGPIDDVYCAEEASVAETTRIFCIY
jgi:hypothetical protein